LRNGESRAFDNYRNGGAVARLLAELEWGYDKKETQS
jgi:hypothetical protein